MNMKRSKDGQHLVHFRRAGRKCEAEEEGRDEQRRDVKVEWGGVEKRPVEKRNWSKYKTLKETKEIFIDSCEE